MDTTKEYIKKLSRAHEITYLKYEIGFTEGDFIWNGETVNICGMDYIQVNKMLMRQQENRGYLDNYIQFAMVEDMPSINFDTDYYPSEISMKYGTYKIKTISNPIWLPRQDQLQEMLISHDKNIKIISRDFHYWCRYETLNTIEQAWLEYVMMVKYNKVWDESEWVSV